MARRGGVGLKVLAALLAVGLAAAVAALVFVVLDSQGQDQAAPEPEGEGLVVRSFSEYSWEELSEVAGLIAAAETDEEGTALAASYGVHVGDARTMELRDGTVVDVTVVGIRQDERADGTGVAGLTLMCSPLATRPMNAEATNAGGWEASELRSWLGSEGLALLPAELSSRVVTVTKRTNNVGVTADAAAVTETADALWLFSASEVCGPVTWFADEYGDTPNAWTGYVDYTVYDALLSSEGEQYAYFAEAGVTGEADPTGVLSCALDGRGVAWWYRTAYPYSFTGDDARFFYQVMSSGFPSSVGDASVAAGVVAGFCL